MKAAVIKSPGVIEVIDVPKPTPNAGEVLLKVSACAICGTDQRVLSGEKAVDVPIVGHEIVGIVEAVGAGVLKDISVGGRYAIQTVIGCGACPSCKRHQENLCEKGFTAIGYQYNGGFAEYMIMPKNSVDQGCLIPVPKDMDTLVGTLLEPLSCCVNGMRYLPLEKADHVVIFGGGIIGVLNGLVARARGAKTITIMDVSPDRLALHQKLGLPFDNFVDSTKTDPVDWVKNATQGRGVDAVVIAASVTALAPLGISLLARNGHLSIFAGMPKSAPVIPIDVNLIHYRELSVHGANSSVMRDYIEAREYLQSVKINGAALVTHTFPLASFNEAVALQKDPSSGCMKTVIVP